MTLKEAIDKAREIKNKAGTFHEGKLIRHIIPAPKDPSLFKSFVSEYYYLYNEIEKKEIDFDIFYEEISANEFAVYSLLVDAELEFNADIMPSWKIIER